MFLYLYSANPNYTGTTLSKPLKIPNNSDDFLTQKLEKIQIFAFFLNFLKNSWTFSKNLFYKRISILGRAKLILHPQKYHKNELFLIYVIKF